MIHKPDYQTEEEMETPWAPSQHKPMSCACVHWNARECAKARARVLSPCSDDLSDEEDDDGFECECCCHDIDEIEYEDYET